MFQNTAAFALEMDRKDPLRSFRDKFFFPLVNGKQALYFTGNSLGLQPKTTQHYVLNELEDWATYGVEGHFHARMPWFSYQDFLTEQVAQLLGALPIEVVAMNSLTTNLHLLMASFYRPTHERYKIICEYDAFPSDLYAVQTQAAFHGFDPEKAVVYLKPRAGEVALREEDVLQAIREHGDSLATVMLGAVNYYTGQFFDLPAIVKTAHAVGATAGFNLAHAAGNVELELHEWGADYACFCSYKYLNSGPGGVSGIFVHERHADDASLPRLAGWWGNDPATRFSMPRNFVPAKGARSWQQSNAPVLSMAALKASLDVFTDAGMMKPLRTKSEQLTGFLEHILLDIDRALDESLISIITPSDPLRRGCQLSVVFRRDGRKFFDALTERSVIVDWREPDVIRVAPVPLYNSFEDVFQFGQILAEVISESGS
ncbi:MAG: kynureninase [Bacteroidota bacterium]